VIPGPEDAASTTPAGPAESVPALLVMHADLATALLHAAEAVYGPIDGVQVLSNEGLSRAQIEARIAEDVVNWTKGGLVLTDFWGGSCHTCALAAARGNGSIVLMTGVNLPMLLDYLHNREHFDVEALAERMLQRGRDNIRTQRGPGA
jgi:mannose/fructose-specific phosphotransferase system component IIA